MFNQERVVIDYVSPQINNGDVFIKRVINEIINVDAHVLVDGHDVIAASVLYKHENAKKNIIMIIYPSTWQSGERTVARAFGRSSWLVHH